MATNRSGRAEASGLKEEESCAQDSSFDPMQMLSVLLLRFCSGVKVGHVTPEM